MADDWDDIEIPEPVARPKVACEEEEEEEKPEPEPVRELTAKEREREEKRLASIAARRAESAMLDAERKARQAEKDEEKRRKEEEAAENRARALALVPKKTDFEREKEAFISDFLTKRKEQDKRAGKGHLWIQRVHHVTRSAKTSEGEVKARQDAEFAWKMHKKL